MRTQCRGLHLGVFLRYNPSRMSTVSRRGIAGAQRRAQPELENNVSQSSRSRIGADRWRVAVLAVVIPAIACVSAVKVARASSYNSAPIVCDGVDDDVNVFVVCGLPEDAAKELALTSIRALPGRTLACAGSNPPRLALLKTHRQPFPPPLLCSKRLPIRRAFRSDDPDGAH
jgi:hypothetical protein